jgi:hypothetical protein
LVWLAQGSPAAVELAGTLVDANELAQLHHLHADWVPAGTAVS